MAKLNPKNVRFGLGRLVEGSAKLNPKNVRFGLGRLVEGSLFVAKLNLRNVRFGLRDADFVYE